MPLFQSAVLKKYLKQQDEARVAQAYAVFTAYFHNAEPQQNILNAKEDRYPEGIDSTLDLLTDHNYCPAR